MAEYDWTVESLPPYLSSSLKEKLSRQTYTRIVSSYDGFGSFHTENVEELIAQPSAVYHPPPLPAALQCILSKTSLAMVHNTVHQMREEGGYRPEKRGREELASLDDGIFYEQALAAMLSSAPTPPKCAFGSAFKREHFLIDPRMVFVNHGGFGSALVGAIEMKHQCELRMEREVVHFVDRELLPLVVYSIRRLSTFFEADCRDIVLVENATFALNSAMKLIEKSDVVAYLDTEYLAVYKMLWFRCKEVGATHHEIAISKYLHDEEVMGDDEALTSLICSQLPAGCTTLVIDHVTSTSAICYPLFSHVIPAVRRRGVSKVIVDGAHGPLQVDLKFNSLPPESLPSAYVGNLHKWFCAPKAVGFLWAPRDTAKLMTSPVLSHGAGDGFLSEFIWGGTRDYGAYFTIPPITDFWETQDLIRVREYCSTLLSSAAEMLTKAFHSRPVSRHSPFMSLVELPDALQHPIATAKYIQDSLHEDFSIEVPVKEVEGRYYLRISAFVYNAPEEYTYLREAVVAVGDRFSATVSKAASVPSSSNQDSTTLPTAEVSGPPLVGALRRSGCSVSGLELHSNQRKKNLTF